MFQLGEQVAPQRHLGRIVGVVLVLQLQLRKAAVGYPLAMIPMTFGSLPFSLAMYDTLAGAYRLRDAVNIRIDAVGRNFFFVLPLASTWLK